MALIQLSITAAASASIFFSIIIRPSKHPKQLDVASKHSIGQIYAIHQVYEVELVPELSRSHLTDAQNPSPAACQRDIVARHPCILLASLCRRRSLSSVNNPFEQAAC
ncbi:hypothetical protein ACLOJK_035085 [Asimina triloba]